MINVSKKKDDLVFYEKSEDIYKVIVIGDPGTGKTELLTKFATNNFQEKYLPTVGVNIFKVPVPIENRTINLLLWDIAGQPQFYMLHRPYFTGADGIILVFDIARSSTFSNINNWWSICVKYGLSEIPRILVGIKQEQISEAERKIILPMADHLSEKLNAPYFVLSLDTGENVKLIFQTIAELIYRYKNGEKWYEIPSVSEPPIPLPGIIICDQCGAVLSGDYAFCNKCGNKLMSIPEPKKIEFKFRTPRETKEKEVSLTATPFRVVKKDKPAKLKPDSMTFQRETEPESIVDYIPQTIISKKEKRKKVLLKEIEEFQKIIARKEPVQVLYLKGCPMCGSSKIKIRKSSLPKGYILKLTYPDRTWDWNWNHGPIWGRDWTPPPEKKMYKNKCNQCGHIWYEYTQYPTKKKLLFFCIICTFLFVLLFLLFI